MDYSMKCPECGENHIYYSHEVGTIGECSRCKAHFELPADDLAVARHVLWAIGGLIGLVLFFVAATYPVWQTYFWKPVK
jgi:uncharacterized protein (DUF983 family)